MACSKTIEITNETGLHTRPGNEFVSLAKTFDSTIQVENETGKKVKGTSLLKLLSLGIKKGTKITVYADGADEQEAVEKLAELLANLKD
ncbi:HPr family phosphocarrier protein [Fusobacterium sp. MFO224]|uniref:HPr family phosphocarrier protein n=1 Tax=Fusobacterium sp. MFO224 TaxID=3378070 RepID=UPI00385364C1